MVKKVRNGSTIRINRQKKEMKKKERMRGKDNAKLVEAEVQGRDLPPPSTTATSKGLEGEGERKERGEGKGKAKKKQKKTMVNHGGGEIK